MTKTKKVQIKIKSYYYGCSAQYSRYLDSYGNIWEGTHSEANKIISNLHEDKYYLGCNEYSRPDYSVTYYLRSH